MTNEYIHIDNLSDIELICKENEIKPIKFIGILKDIIHTKESIYFKFSLLNSNNDILITKLKINETFSKLNGNLSTKLLLRSLNLRITEDFNKEWQMKDIFNQKICLFCIDAQCGIRDSQMSIFLEDMNHLSIKKFAEYSLNFMKLKKFVKNSMSKHDSSITEWHIESVTRCFKTLCKMDSNPNDLFSFEQLADKEDIESNRMKNLIHYCQTTNKRQRFISTPLINRFPVIDSLASQNDFNSQAMDTQRSFRDSDIEENDNENEIFTDANQSPSADTIGIIDHNIDETDTNRNNEINNDDDLVLQEMRLIPIDERWDPQLFLNMQLNSSYKIQAKYVGSRKLSDYNEIYLKPVNDYGDEEDNKDFKPKFKKSDIILLEPYYNCIQTKSCPSTNIIIGDNINLKINASLRGVEHNDKIPYIMPELRFYDTEKLKPREFFTEPPPVESFKKWKDISIDDKMPQFVKTVAILVSCTYDSSSYVDIVFTDFTTNENGHKYGVLPQNLISEQHYLRFDDCIKARIYDNQFAKFMSELKKIGYDDLANELKQDGQTERIKNLSTMGIICELTLKVTKYNDNLSLIVRKCDPLPRQLINERRWYNDKKAISNLHDLYEITERKFKELCISFKDEYKPVLTEYMRYFPFQLSDSDLGAMIIIPPDELYFENPLNNNENEENNNNNNNENENESPIEPITSTIPDLNIDISEFRITNQTENFNILYKLQTDDNEIFVVENMKLLSWDYMYRANTIILTVTDDLTSRKVTDPTRLLKIHIINRENLIYFCNGDQDLLSLTHLHFLIGEIFNFKLQTGKLKLNDKYLLKVFCPIECTYEELKTQLEVNNAHAEDKGDIDNENEDYVKQEMEL